MAPPWLDGLLAARVYDLEQPRFRGMPIHPSHRPGYFYALHRRHRDTYCPAEQGVIAVGADNMAWDAPDDRDPETGATLFAHVYLLPQKGVYIIENVNLEELARDRRWEFAFVGAPLKFQGATGSQLRPLALAL